LSREYAKVRPRFWTGDTGKLIRKLGRDCQVIGFYLMTCPSANMLGLYYLSMPTLCHETASPFKGALKALRSLQEAKFAYYDLPSEIVYVPNMAREQIGDRLKRKDNRHVAVLRELETLRKTPFFTDFVIRYRDAFELQDVAIDPTYTSPFEAPSKPLRSQEQEQEKEHEQEQEQEKEHEQEHEQEKDKELTSAADAAVAIVFEHWRSAHNHPRSQLDAKRRKAISAALKSYSVADLCQTITGYLNSAWHMGQNEKDTKFDDVELFLRDAKHIDAGLKFYAEPPRADLSEKSRRIIDQTKDWTPPETRNASH
jgi:hypothetical protein